MNGEVDYPARVRTIVFSRRFIAMITSFIDASNTCGGRYSAFMTLFTRQSFCEADEELKLVLLFTWKPDDRPHVCLLVIKQDNII